MDTMTAEATMTEEGKCAFVKIQTFKDLDLLTETWAAEAEVHLEEETRDTVEDLIIEMVATEMVATEMEATMVAEIETSPAIEEVVQPMITHPVTEKTSETEEEFPPLENSCSMTEAHQEETVASEEDHPEMVVASEEASITATKKRTESGERAFASSARTRGTWPRIALTIQALGVVLIDLVVMVVIKEDLTTTTTKGTENDQ